MGHHADGRKARNGASRHKAVAHREDLPAVIAPSVAAPVIKTGHGVFDLDAPHLPKWVEARAFKSGGFPYDDRLDDAICDEGRDAAGKGGSIFVFRQYLNPRQARTVALPSPTETERGQWYFQRYVAELPTAG